MLLSLKTSVANLYKKINFTPDNCVRCEGAVIKHTGIFDGLYAMSSANTQACRRTQYVVNQIKSGQHFFNILILKAMHLFRPRQSYFKVKVKATKCTYRSLVALTKNPSVLYILRVPVSWVKICGLFVKIFIIKTCLPSLPHWLGDCWNRESPFSVVIKPEKFYCVLVIYFSFTEKTLACSHSAH